jgi:DNA-binding CsgD family transcriptional regulator/tetratricopeptide (TPR) repeat protein
VSDITIRHVHANRFVGRASELAQLTHLVAGVADGVGGALLVVGEQGIGKSALLRAGLAGAAGGRVCWAAADELEQRFPLSLMAACLGADGRQAVDDVTVSSGVDPAGRAGAGAILSGDPVLAGAERLLTLVDRLCAQRPLVLVAEDLQWADEASLLVWQRLSQTVGQLPLVLLGSCRPTPAHEEVLRLQRSLTARGGAVLALGPLPPGDVAELAEGVLGAQPEPSLAGLVDHAGGNPLYVQELLDALVRDGRVRVGEGAAQLVGEPGGVPASLAAAIGERLSVLSAATAGMLRWAAVLGQEFSVTDLSLVTGSPAGELVDVVEQAVAAGVVSEAGPRLVFRHGLIRQMLHEGIPAPVREALHLQAAQALARAGVAAERVAAQLVAASEADGEWVWEWLAGAAPALTSRAPVVAAELLRRALRQVPPDDPRRDAIEAALVAVAFVLVLDEEVEQVARRVLTRTRSPGRAGEVAWLLGYTLARTGRTDEALEVVETALGRPDISPLWVPRLKALQALTLTGASQWDRVTATAAEALTDAGRTGDRFAAGYALHAQSIEAFRGRDERAVLGYIDRGLEVIGDAPDTADLRLVLLSNRAVVLGWLDRHDEAGTMISQALALAERVGTPRLATIYITAAEHHFDMGQWDDAIAVLQTVAVLPDLGNLPIRLHGLLALIAGHRDDRATADEHLAAAGVVRAGDFAAGLWLLLAQALAAERAGHAALAADVLAPCLEAGYAADMPELYRLFPVLARLALAAGDSDTATAAARAAAAEAGPGQLPARAAAARHCRGLADGDPAPVLAAAAYYESAGRLPARALALEDAAVLLAAQGQLVAARTAFTDASALYLALGAARDLRRADSRLRGYGVRRGHAGRRARPAHGWDALTPTETKIAYLVADGCSNPDIAADLFLSRNTVQTHVSHILAKLRARSRAEIVRLTLARSAAD